MQVTLQIPGYDSLEQIALGGMATVYKATKVSLGRSVAIKILYQHLAQDVVFIERFKREAQTAAKLHHDNIVNVIDYGENNGAHYIVMEYYDGVTLEDLLKDHSTLPLDVCFAIILNVCRGLEAAHSENLVHRDIKPANIIYTRHGGVKVADFGLAKTIEKKKPITHDGKIIGTPAYMSPEQTRGEYIGAQSDIFSLGVVAYELVCGKRPFDGDSYSAVVDQIQSQELQPVYRLNPLVDASFAAIIARMVEKNPSKRYEHVSEVLMDLEEAIDKQGYKRDPRTLAEYFKYPQSYLEKFNAEQLEKLLDNPPPAESGNAEVRSFYYGRLLYLDPSNEKAREECERLGVDQQRGQVKPAKEPDKAAWERTTGRLDAAEETVLKGGSRATDADPDTEYQVILEAVDSSLETPASFALKLSMRIRSPLPRVMSIVKNMPTRVGGRLSSEKANQLASIIEELGGVPRVIVHTEESGTVPEQELNPKSEPETPPKPDPPSDKKSFDQAKTEQFHPIDSAGVHQKASTVTCPKCGWEEDGEAKFCSICLFAFNKMNAEELKALGKQVINNPLADPSDEKLPPTSLLDTISGLPNNVKYGGLGALVILLLLIIFNR